MPMRVQSADRCVHELFEAQASRTPEAVAVQFEEKCLTYCQLSEQSNRLARVLQKSGVHRESRVALYVERSIEMVVALLGTLKAGGAYIPIDPAHGKGRMEHIAGEAGYSVLITQKSVIGSLPAIPATIVVLDGLSEFYASESSKYLASINGPSDLAYMIYTSGSTGEAKGVQIEHRSLVNFLCSMRQEPGFAASDRLLAVTTLAFDIAGLEMFLPLLTGGRVVIASRETVSSGRLLMQSLEKSRATVMQATPATWRLLFESGWPGDRRLRVFVGGDVLSAELGRELVSRCGEVWNMYGPTETTIWSSIYRVNGRERRVVPIGRPIANTEFHILDNEHRQVSVGEEGELYIGGEGLARGYFERSQLTAERFLPDFCSSREGARLYRTGDLARVAPDGNVQFLGRMDHQVKMRGFRIEPGEIETVLDRHPHVQHSVVLARENGSGEKILVAYFVADLKSTVRPTQLREHLRARVPEYMLPSAFVRLAALPLTPNGKVDRAALPAPHIADFQSDQDYVAPRNSIERKLVAIWQEVLAVRPVGIKTGFFDLGGNSILAVRVFVMIQRVFGRELPISTLFQAPTIEKFAEVLQSNKTDEAYANLIPVKPGGSKRPLFCVHGGFGGTLFFSDLATYLDPDQPFYAIESEGLDGAPFHRRTVEEMASHYISEIRKIQPDGPYFIGGYCFGGIVAFEMAHQLSRRGEHVAMVVQFSTPLAFNGLERPAPVSMQGRFLRLSRCPVRVMRERLSAWKHLLRTRVALTLYPILQGLGIRVPQRMRHMYVVRMLGRAEENYVPSPYAGKLTLFYGRGDGTQHSAPNMGWNGLANDIETYVIGDRQVFSRRSILVEPLVRQLATALNACLDRASEGHRTLSAAKAETRCSPAITLSK